MISEVKVLKDKDKNKKNNHGVFLVVLTSFLISLGLVYLGISVYFLNHFCFNTMLNGKPVAGASELKVRELWEEDVAGYSLDIIGRDGTRETIKGSDISLSLQWDDSVSKLIKTQNGFLWITKLFRPDELTCETIVSYNEGQLDEKIKNLSCMEESKQIMPKDAKVSEYSEADGFTVECEVEGTAIDHKLFKEGLMMALYGLWDSYDIAEDGGYIRPQVFSDNENLINAVDTMNEYAKAKINYDLGDEQFVLDASTFQHWFKYKNDDMTPVLSKKKIEKYVDKLADKYNTCYTEKTLETSYGKTVTIQNSRYGWRLDKEAETKEIYKNIKAKEPVTRDLNFDMRGNSHGEHDYGDSYVEINLTAQHLFLYKDGELIIESDLVSGNVAKGHSTPCGAFGVTYTERNATLNGDDYSTPVGFWMPFNGNVGMHDATWRRSFGGSIYKTGGSHGCVNLPYSTAQTIFNNISKNYPVLVYELPGTEKWSKN